MGRLSAASLLRPIVLGLLTVQLVSAQAFSCTGGSVYVVAHPDDDLLFQSPDIYQDIAAGNCVTTVYLTSGDSGIGSTYALSRESGAEAAHTNMQNVTNAWTQYSAIFGGQPVTVWFRLPDGGISGVGYPSTGYQTLRELFFGSLTSINSQPGTSTFTLATLTQAVGQILAARQPLHVRTLDFLSDYDGGDHSDHLSVARITKALVAGYVPGASVQGYMGYSIQNLPPTLQTSDPLFVAKSNAFFSYTPYDSGECSSYQNCVNAGRAEGSWLTRQYVVTPSLSTRATNGAAQVQPVIPTTQNVALLAVASASSAGSSQPAKAMNDGIISGYPGNASAEWSSDHGLAGTTATLTWSSSYSITAVALFDRINPSDQITSGTLTFSDGTVVATGVLPNDGSAYVVTLPNSITTTFITFTVSSASASTSSVGLAEFQAFGTAMVVAPVAAAVYSSINLAFSASVSASSQSFNPDSVALRAIDANIGGYKDDGSGDSTMEWSSNGERAGATLTLSWSSPVQVARVILFDRPNAADQVTGGLLTFSDGSTVVVPSLANDGSATPVSFPVVTTTSIVFSVTSVSSSTSNVGLSEIQVFGLASSPTANGIGPVNWARYSTATASSNGGGQGPSKAIDNRLDGYTPQGGNGYAEWASDHGVEGTTFTLTWASPVTLSSLVIYDRPNTADWIQGATIQFSDGGVATIPSLNNDGSATIFNLGSTIQTTSILFTVTAIGPSTSGVGLSEFQAFSALSGSSSAITVPVVYANGAPSSSSVSSAALSTSSPASSVATTSTASLIASSSASSSAPSSSALSTSSDLSTPTTPSASSSSSDSSSSSTPSQSSAATVVPSSSAPSSSTSSQAPLASSIAVLDSASTLASSTTAPAASSAAPASSSSAPVSQPVSSISTSSSAVPTSSVVASTATSSSAAASQSLLSPVATTLWPTSTIATKLSMSAINLAFSATISASSELTSTGQRAVRVADGVFGGFISATSGDPTVEWVTNLEKVGATLTMTWASPVQVAKLRISDRFNSKDQVMNGTLTFSGGQVIAIPTLLNAGNILSLYFAPFNTTSVVFTVTGVSPTTTAIGLAELAFYGPAASALSLGVGPINWARYSIATASSQTASQVGSKAVDGVLAGLTTTSAPGDSFAEWSSSNGGVGTTLNVAFTYVFTIASIVLFDRPNMNDWITGGTITLSTGGIITVPALNNNGAPLIINFPATKVSSLLFTVTSVGPNSTGVGLEEIRAFTAPSTDPAAIKVAIIMPGASSSVTASSASKSASSVASTPAASSTSKASSAASSTQVSSSSAASSKAVSSAVASSTMCVCAPATSSAAPASSRARRQLNLADRVQ